MVNILLCTGLAFLVVIILMGYITLKNKLNSLEEQICAVNLNIDGQVNRMIAEIGEREQFEEKALGTLAQNMAVCGYELKEVKESNKQINKSIKDESAKNIFMHLRNL